MLLFWATLVSCDMCSVCWELLRPVEQTAGRRRDEQKGRSPRINPHTPVVQPLYSVTIRTSANVLHLHLYLHSTFLLKFPF